MANYQLLKADIDAKVYQNGQQEITGANLNSASNAMATTLGAEYQFAGVATIDTNPGTPDAKVFYIANGKGTYTNFGSLEVTDDEVVILYWDTAWHKEVTGIASADKLNQLGQKTYNLVPVNSSYELYDRSTVHLEKDLRTTDGVEVDSTTWNCSPFIPIDVNVPLFVTAYSNYVYLYDSTQAYLGRVPITNGRTIASYGSQYLSTAYLRIIYNNTMLYTARVGLTEHENFVKDYFVYDNQPIPGSKNLVPSGEIYKFTNGFEISQGGVIYDYLVVAGKKYFIKNTGNIFGLSVSFYENGTAISEISLNPGEYAIYDAQSSSSGIRLSNAAGASAIIYEMSTIGGKVAKAQEDITKVQEDIIGFPVTITKSKYNLVKGKTYVISNIGSYQYPLNVYGYDIKGNEYTLVSNLLPNETRTFVVSQNGLVYISLSSVAGASAIVYEMNTISGKVAQVQKNPIHLRVATFNVGDYTGKTFDVGSEDGKLLHRKLIGESGANIFGTQEDLANYGGANIASSFWQMFKYYNRLGNSNYNYKAFASDFPIVGIKQVFYTNTETYQFRHPWFLDGILYVNGREIHLASFHFDWSDNDTRREQIRQIIEYYSTYENIILMGDTNCENYVNEQPQEPHNLYDVEWPIFADAGYDMANNGYFGVFNTVGYDEQTQYPLDNIFIKGNIRIKNADIIVKDWTNDHCMLYADLAIY